MDRWLQLWFSFRGRISRSDYWLRITLPLFLGVIVVILIEAATGLHQKLTPIWQVFSLWPSFAAGVKRFHDRDRSGRPFVYLYLASLVLLAASMFLTGGAIAREEAPGALAVLLLLVGVGISIYLFVIVGFFKGTAGPNRYGPDPLAPVEAF